MNRQQTLAGVVRSSGPLLERYLAGFDDSNRTTTTPSLPNHAAWTLGHLALYNHRAAERFDGQPLPPDQFVSRDGLGGDATRFDTESVAFASDPATAPDAFPTMARAVEIMLASIERLAAAVESSSDAQLDSAMAWGRDSIPMWVSPGRMVFHMGTHTGQLIDLRRALGLGAVL